MIVIKGLIVCCAKKIGNIIKLEIYKDLYIYIYIRNLNRINRLDFRLILKLFKNSKIKSFYEDLFYKYLKLRFKLLKKASFPILDFQITTRCTLQCEQCSIYIPYYTAKTHYTETFETFKERLDNLLKNVDYIFQLQILGGEPLLNKDLAKMIEYASQKKQIKVITTVTNSTILPNKELLAVYKTYQKKNYIIISDYTSNPELKNLKINELKKLLKENDISYIVVQDEWSFMGRIQKENRSKEELLHIMTHCYQKNCHAYYNGKLFLCSRISPMIALFDAKVSDYVEVTANDCSQEIIELFCKRYFEACDYCHIEPDKKLPRAIQIKQTGENCNNSVL